MALSFNYNYTYSRGTNVNTLFLGADTLLAAIQPNLENNYTKQKKRQKICTALIPIFFICMGLSIALIFITGSSQIVPGFEDWQMGNPPYETIPNLVFIPFVVICFICGIISIILVSVSSFKSYKLNNLTILMQEIRSQDKVSIENLSLSKNSEIGKSSIIMIIKKLIETENLVGFEVVGEVGVAKVEIGARESDFISKQHTGNIAAATSPSDAKPKRHSCPNCGAAITNKTNNSCQYCNTKLF